jgi:endo-1,4-beta-xylanase
MIKKQRGIGRRQFLLASGIVASTATLMTRKLEPVSQEAQALNDASRNFSVTDNTSLCDRAAAKGLIYGAFPSVGYEKLSQEDLKLRSSFTSECSLLVGGFYWKATRPSINTFNFTETDAFAAFAASNSMLFRGHPLVWNQLLPPWLTEKFENRSTSSKEIENILTNHITTVARRYSGRIHSWDVVNEAVWPEDYQVNGLRKTPWLKFLGSDYINIAFHAAREADPKALLVYNGDRLDHDTSDDEARRVATLNLLEDLVDKGAPVGALGIQAHLRAGRPINLERLRSFLQDIASLGLKILITELDVNDSELSADVTNRDRTVASVYEDYLNVVLDEPAVIAVLTWGLSDRYTWLSKFSPRFDRLPVRPLPLDEGMNRKLAWNAIARAFNQAPAR